MTDATWRCDGQRAELTGRVCGQIDLTRPHDGVLLSRVAGQPLAGCRFGAVELEAAIDAAQFDCHVRACDLVATYSDTAARPLAVDVVWRTLPGEPDLCVAGLDVIVSVRTPLLESRPTLTLASKLPAGEIRRLRDAASGAFIALAKEAVMREPADGPSCTLFRWPDGPLSYAEMIYPPDFQRDELAPRANGGVALRHELFGSSLEKGVILRCWLRGVFVPRESDEEAAAACYRKFSAAEPWLGT